MAIRMIAKELYLLVQEVEKIEKQLKNAPADKHEELKDQLRKAKAERNRMRSILEGKKGQPKLIGRSYRLISTNLPDDD